MKLISYARYHWIRRKCMWVYDNIGHNAAYKFTIDMMLKHKKPEFLRRKMIDLNHEVFIKRLEDIRRQ